MANLVDVNDYKVYKAISNPKNDTKIASIMTAVNSIITTYCGRTFIDYFSTNKTELFTGKEKLIFLDEFPLVSVVSLKTSDDGGATYSTTLVENTDFFVKKDEGVIASNGSYFTTATAPFNNVEVVYKGGYVKTPDDIRIAALDLIDYYMNEEYIPSRSLQSGSMVNISSQDFQRFPPHVRRILEMYRSNV